MYKGRRSRLAQIQRRLDPVIRFIIETDALQAVVVVAHDGAVFASVTEVATAHQTSVHIALFYVSTRF